MLKVDLMGTKMEPLASALPEVKEDKRKMVRSEYDALPKEQKEVTDRFIEYLGSLKKARMTKVRYRYTLAKFLGFAGNDFRFETATREQLQQIVTRIYAVENKDKASREDDGLSPETVRKILVAIKSIYKWHPLFGDQEDYPKLVKFIKTSGGGSKKKLPEDLFNEEEIRSSYQNNLISIRLDGLFMV